MALVDNYRVTLFKKKLRKIIGAPWLRFYWSKGRCHLVIRAGMDFREEEIPSVIHNLKAEQIEFKAIEDMFGLAKIFNAKPKVDQICIPIDQEALPERKRN